MRYSVISKGLSLSQMETEVLKAGGKSVKKAALVDELFCELDEPSAEKLSTIPGLKVRPVRVITPTSLIADPVLPVGMPAAQQIMTVSDVFQTMRSYFMPPLSGMGLTVAVLDSGIRKTHESLKRKIVYEFNATEAPGHDDIYGHGTGVAYLIAGGTGGVNGRGGVSPGASIINIKVLDDEGIGTEETVVMGIDKVCQLAQDAREAGRWPTDEMYPNIINVSIGAEDTGEVDDPMRIACRKAIEDYGIDVIAAAGNAGPRRTTMMLPAAEPEVIAVGGVITGDLQIWERSSRGPTVLGDTKPDFVFWATSLEVASHRGDDRYDEKSGTSFAAPMVSGLAGLLWETGRRSYGEAWTFRWTRAREFAPFFSIKPADAPMMKGNTYGYGMPAMGTMVGMIDRPEPVFDVTRMLPMIMMMGMIGVIGRR
ncbi:S8 family serine peptidase [Dehalococcoidia bacterium]|nr:S8 family serine peptidase [Dehalococcoidia bacterium]